MLENGMISGAESRDPQCREPQKDYCVQCKQMVPVHELTEFANGERVCRDCETEYLKLNGADFVPEYIQQNEWEFYGEWWFSDLGWKEQLEIIKAGYLAANLDPVQHDYLERLKVDFCKEDDRFLQFVKEKLL